MILVVVDVLLFEVSTVDRQAFHREMLARQWTCFSSRENAYCAAMEECETEADAVSAVESHIEEVTADVGVKQWSAVCYVPRA